MSALITPEGLARLDAALAWIDEHPQQHDQDMWFVRNRECGTTMCLAGIVAHLAGAEPIWNSPERDATGTVLTPGGVTIGVSIFAAALLETDADATSQLFYEADDRVDLGEVRDRLAESLDGAA